MSLMDAANKAFTSYENKIAKLEADNAALKLRTSDLKRKMEELRDRTEVAEAENARLRAEVDDYKRGMLSDRARLALAEAVCEAIQSVDPVSAHVEKALAAWREGKA